MEGGCLAQKVCFLCRICEYSDRMGLSDVSGFGKQKPPKCDRVDLMAVFQDPSSRDAAEIYRAKVTSLCAE
jgi:hypothetical protein